VSVFTNLLRALQFAQNVVRSMIFFLWHYCILYLQ